MNEFTLASGDPYVLLSHVALYGLGAILEDAGVDIRLTWTAHTRPLPQITGPDIDPTLVGSIVRDHAHQLAGNNSWLTHDITLGNTPRGLMSPRLTQFGDDATWAKVQKARHAVLDELTATGRWLDLRQIAALGEPAYWSRNRKNEVLQDDGASRLEMQPRNQGSEIVGARLRKLAAAVGARSAAQIANGLRGVITRDEVGNDKPDSRTATGFANPGPTDNALAWCALWGISQLPLAMRVGNGTTNATAITTGHLGRNPREWFYTPIWQQPWRPARLRSVLCSAQLRTAAAVGLPSSHSTIADLAARTWLSARDVVGVVRFPIARFGSDSAPERRAMRGEALPTHVTTPLAELP